jgi:UDP-2,4-diacetamido-2,4,6-trideoxy-beta-L-altropyranose hydrolase
MAVLIRADASVPMGTGHVMRCLALAQRLASSRIPVAFASSGMPELLQLRVEAEKIPVFALSEEPGTMQDALTTIRLAAQMAANWIVLDGYHFSLAFQERLHLAGYRILLIDDSGQPMGYVADLILNQNLVATPDLYPQLFPGSELLLGTKFVLLRNEFLRAPVPRREFRPLGGKLLITMGGSDPKGYNLQILQQLAEARIDDLTIRITSGIGQHVESQVRHFVARYGVNASVPQMSETMFDLMNWADLAISAGGSTCWELAYLGVPGILLQVAENQMASMSALARSQIFLCFDEDDLNNGKLINACIHLLGDLARRQHLSEAAQTLVDGRGAERVVQRMLAREGRE